MGLPATDSNAVAKSKSKTKKSPRVRTRVKAARRAVKKAVNHASEVKKGKRLNKKQQEAIIIEHRDHGRRLAWSFLSSWRIRLAQDEVVSVVGAALCEAAVRFDPSREVAFKTFFFYHLRGLLLKEISKMIQNQKVLQLSPGNLNNETLRADQISNSHWDYNLIETENPEKITQRRQIASACWDACAQLDTLEQEVLLRFFVHDEPLVNIAKGLGYCRCHISRVKSRALSKLGKLLREPSEVTGAQGVLVQRKAGSTEDYTGGRGRRKDKNLPDESKTLTALRENAY